MFSYGGAVLQTGAAERRENQFNGAGGTSVGILHRAKGGEATADASHKYFALDSSARLVHSGIASRTIFVADSAKPMFAYQP
jgi:hypothetical protein